MGITAWSGPNLTYGQVGAGSTSGVTSSQQMEYNSQRSPNVSDLGNAMMDPRAAYSYNPGAAVTAKTYAFYQGCGIVDYVPILGSSAFVAAATVTTGVSGAFTLTASSAVGTYATTIIAPETGAVTGTLLAIDSTAAYLSMGSDGTVAMWNPGAGTGRCISITTSSSGDAGTWSVAGRDMYGFKMTETIALSEGTSNSSGYTIYGKKAFKYVSAINNTTTPVSTSVTIGIADKFGLPLYTPYSGNNLDLRICPTVYASSLGLATTSSLTYVIPSTAATQTSTTPDVRGTWTSTTATNGTLRIQILVTPAASAIAAITSTNVAPLFGGLQYSSV